ncbi:MAG: caspase family protein [Myxococcales bacterium]|nr:caspase family protein [Myxococcales bacterium]
MFTRLCACAAMLVLPTTTFGGIVLNRYDAALAPAERDPLQRAYDKSDHGISLATYERWVALSKAPCTPRETPRATALAISVDTIHDPGSTIQLNTSGDRSFMASLFRSKGVDTVTELHEPTHSVVQEALTKALESSVCGDRVYLSYAGTGVHLQGRSGPTSSILFKDSALDCLVRSQCDDPRTLTSDDLATFVMAARNRGVTPVLFMDSCHGTDIGERGAEPVWSHHSAPDRTPLTLQEGAAEFAAFFAADPESVALEIRDEDAVGGAFTFGLAQALRGSEHPTPRTVADGVTAHLARVTPDQVPLIQASDPDLPLFGHAARETRGAAQLADGARIELTARGLRRGENGERWLRVPSDKRVTLRGRVRPATGVQQLLVGGSPVALNRGGSFETTVTAPADEGAVPLMVTAVFEDFSLKTEPLKVVRPAATEHLVQGSRYALLIGVQDYPAEGLDSLTTPLADIDAVHSALTEGYGFTTTLQDDAGNDHSLVLQNPTARQILQALELLVNHARPDDQVLVYYAGHSAIPTDLEQAYWLPTNADARSTVDWVSADRVRDQIKRMAATSVLVVSDSCYSAALTRALDTEEEAPGGGSKRGALLTRVTQSRSRLLISSGAFEPVLDGGGSGHSVFARALLTGLQEQQADAFTSAELFVPLRERVVGQSQQEPQRRVYQGSGHDAGDFVFVRTD